MKNSVELHTLKNLVKQIKFIPVKTKKTKANKKQQERDNKYQQDVDKAPRAVKGKDQKLMRRDLKGKKVNADPATESGRPVENPA